MTKKPDIKATILGSGTCVPSLKRGSCSVLLETGSSKIVMDIGPGTMRRLLEAGVEIFDVTHVFISHFHPDHCAELVPFLFSNKYPNIRRKKKPLTIVGGPGFADFHKGLAAVHGEWIQLPSELLNIIELDGRVNNRVEFDRFHLEIAPVKHRPESLAFRVAGPGGAVVVYSGDTDCSDNLVALASGADLFICESAVPDELRIPGHLTPSLAGLIASRAGVSHLVLTHFYPECDQIDIEKQCRKTYNGKFTCARDLMVFELP